MRSDISIYIDKINDRILKTKKRYYFITYSNSLLKCMFLFIAFFVLFFTLTPFLFSYEIYKGALVSALVSTFGFLLIRDFILPILRKKSNDFFALLLERVTPGINNLIINSVQLSALSPENVKKFGFSKDLIALTVREASLRIDEAPLKEAVDSKVLKKRLVIFVAVLSVIFFTYFSNPNYFKKTYLKFIYPELFLEDNPFTTIEEVKKERLNLPEIGDFRITYQYPEYSRLKEKIVSGGNGDIKCLKGTLVKITAKSDRGVQGVDFVFNDMQKVAATVSNETQISYESFILEPGVYHLEFKDVDYPEGFEHTLYQVMLEEDEYPFIKLTSPTEDFTVEENDDITIGYESSDDFGIGEVNLVIERETGTETINVFKPDGQVTDISDRYRYDLSLLNLIPGEVLKVYLETYDNDTISGPKKSISNERYLDVFSKEKKKQEIVKMKERLFETLIDLLGDHFEKSLVDTDLESTLSIVDNQRSINSKVSDIIMLIDEILTALKENELTDDRSYIPLSNMKVSIRDLFDSKDTLVNSISSDSYDVSSLKADVATLKQLKEEEIKETEEDILYLDNEKKKEQMDNIIKEGEELLASEKSLLEMLEKLKEDGDMSDAKEKLEEIIKQMEETMNKIMEKLSKFPQSLPDEFVNNDSMKNVDIKQDKSVMEKLKESLANNDIEEALKLANELLDSMNKMMSSFENSASEFAQNDPKDMMQELDEAISDIDEIEKKQDEVMQETKKLDKAAREKRAKAQEKEVDDFVKKQQQLLDEIRKDVRGMQQELMSNPPDKSDLPDDAMHQQADFHDRKMPSYLKDEKVKKAMKINQMINEMPMMLKKDFNQAEKLASDMLKETDELKEAFTQDKNKKRMKKPGSLEKFNKNAKDAVKNEKKLLEAFNDFKKDTDNFLSEEQKGKLKAMAPGQEGIQSDLDGLMEKLGKKAGNNPGLGDKSMRKDLAGAGNSMGEAKNALQKGKASSALPQQGDAMSKLGSAKGRLMDIRDQMGQMPGMQPGGQQQGQPERGREQGQMGRGVNVDDVNLPGQEDYKVPKEFREDILKGMKEKYPKEYEKRVKKYYEELIK